MWEDNVKMGLRERGWGRIDKIHLVQHRDQWRDLVNTVITFAFRKILGNS
jgi:hypothetical protein